MLNKTHIQIFILLLINNVQSGFVDTPVGCVTYPIVTIPLCSGRGICIDQNHTRIFTPNVPDSRCVCDDGWTGTMDIINMRTHQCTQKIIVLKVFYSFNLILALIESIVVFHKLYKCLVVLKSRIPDDRNQQYPVVSQNNNDGSQHSGGSSTNSFDKNILPATDQEPVRTNRKFLSNLPHYKTFFSWIAVKITLFGLFHSLSLISLSFIRLIAYETQLVGYNLFPTLVYIIQEQSFWMAVRTHNVTMLKVRGSLCRFSADDRKQVQWANAMMKRAGYFLYLSDGLRMLSILCILFVPTKSQLLGLIYLESLCLSIVVFSSIFYYTGKKIESILLDGYESLSGKPKEDRTKALKALRAVLTETLFGVFGALPLLFVVGWWPFLRSNMAYTAWQMGLPTITFTVNVHLLNPPKVDIQDDTSHRERQDSSHRERGYSHHTGTGGSIAVVLKTTRSGSGTEDSELSSSGRSLNIRKFTTLSQNNSNSGDISPATTMTPYMKPKKGGHPHLEDILLPTNNMTPSMTPKNLTPRNMTPGNTTPHLTPHLEEEEPPEPMDLDIGRHLEVVQHPEPIDSLEIGMDLSGRANRTESNTL